MTCNTASTLVAHACTVACTPETRKPPCWRLPVCVKESHRLLPRTQCAVKHHWDCCADLHFRALVTLLKKKCLVIHLSVNRLWPEHFTCFALGGNSRHLSAAFVCMCGCCRFLDFPKFCQTLLTSMRVGHTGRDTARVSKRAHCQLSSLSSYLACLLLLPLLSRHAPGFTTLQTHKQCG